MKNIKILEDDFCIVQRSSSLMCINIKKNINYSHKNNFLAYTYIRGGICMEISNDKMFKIGYSGTLRQTESKKEKGTSRIINFISKHKIVTLFILIFCTCCTLNFVLIYNFIQILEKM